MKDLLGQEYEFSYDFYEYDEEYDRYVFYVLIDGEKKYQLTDFMSVSPTNVYKWLALHLDYYSPD